MKNAQYHLYNRYRSKLGWCSYNSFLLSVYLGNSPCWTATSK